MKTVAIAIFAAMIPSLSLADDCALMKDSRHVYDFSSDADIVSVVGGKNCQSQYAPNVTDDLTPDILVKCDGLNVSIIFQAGEFFANENGKEEQLVEACGA